MEDDEPRSRARHFRSVAERLRRIANGYVTIFDTPTSFAPWPMGSSGSQPALNKRLMPYQSLEEEVGILRTKAEKLRELATAHATPPSPQLLEWLGSLRAGQTRLRVAYACSPGKITIE